MESLGLNVMRDPLCLIQISTGELDAHSAIWQKKIQCSKFKKIVRRRKNTKYFIMAEPTLHILNII